MVVINQRYSMGHYEISDAINAKRAHSSLLIILARHSPLRQDGGIESCIRSEMRLASIKGFDVLLVTPHHLDFKIHEPSEKNVLLSLNGENIGSSLIDSLAMSLSLIKPKSVIYHSVIGFDLSALIRVTLEKKVKFLNVFWAHDLSYICESQILIRDDIFCSLQTVDSLYCNGCEHQHSRLPLHKFYTRFIKQVDLFIFPSHIAKERFFNYFNFPYMSNIDYKILPHYQVTSKKNARPTRHIKNMPIGFSFFGHNVAHKGWYKFLNLVGALESTGKFKFYHIGTAHHSDDRIKHIPFSELEHDDPLAELDLLCKSHNISLAFFWSITLESFGMMLRQVLATHCAVLARGDDPALREFIDDCDKIKFFNEFDDLISFVKDEDAVNDLLDKAAQTVCTLEESEYSFSVLT